jgi:hypothetical protein
MKTVISISEARKKLPSIIRQLKTHPDTVYCVTVHNEVVAEIKTSPQVKPGAAAAGLLALRKRTGKKTKAKKYPVSENIKDYLYVAEGKP